MYCSVQVKEPVCQSVGGEGEGKGGAEDENLYVSRFIFQLILIFIMF